MAKKEKAVKEEKGADDAALIEPSQPSSYAEVEAEASTQVAEADTERLLPPPPKRTKRTVDPFASGSSGWLSQPGATNPSSGLLGGKNMRGATVNTAIVISVTTKTYQNEKKSGAFYIIKATVIDDTVSVPHEKSLAETNYAAQLGKSPIIRKDIVYTKGDTLIFTSFQPPKKSVFHGSIVTAVNLTYSIRPPSKTENGLLPEPSLSVNGDIAKVKSDPSFDALFAIVKELAPPTIEQLVAASLPKPPLPTEVYKVPDGEDATRALVDVNAISDETFFKRMYTEQHAWVVLDNRIYHDGDIMATYEDAVCPVFVVPHPPEGEEIGADKQNYLSKEKKDADAKDPKAAAKEPPKNAAGEAELVVPCVRKFVPDSKGFVLEGESVGSDDVYQVDMPFYEAQHIYDVHTKEIWPLVGGQLFRGTRAVVGMRLRTSDIVQHARFDEQAVKLFCYPTLHLDYVSTFRCAGYRITKECATKWLRANFDTSEIPLADKTTLKLTKPTKNNKNPWTALFSSPNLLFDTTGASDEREQINHLKVVCLHEVTCDSSKQFGEGWEFYAVPAWTARAHDAHDKPTHVWVREEGIYKKNLEAEKDECAANSALVEQLFGQPKQDAKKVIMFAVNVKACSS